MARAQRLATMAFPFHVFVPCTTFLLKFCPQGQKMSAFSWVAFPHTAKEHSNVCRLEGREGFRYLKTALALSIDVKSLASASVNWQALACQLLERTLARPVGKCNHSIFFFLIFADKVQWYASVVLMVDVAGKWISALPMKIGRLSDRFRLRQQEFVRKNEEHSLRQSSRSMA